VKTEPPKKIEPLKFELPKIDIPKPSIPAAPKKSTSVKKKSQKPKEKFTAPKFDLPKIEIPKPAVPKAPPTPKKVVAKKFQPKKIEYSFPSETPPAQTKASKFELPKFGGTPKKAAPSKSEIDTRAVDSALKRKKEAEAKAAEAKRQKQLEAKLKAEKATQVAAERKRIQEQKQQEKLEAQRLAAEKRQQQAEEKRQQVEALRAKQAAKAKALQDKKAAANQKAQRKQVAEKSLGQAKSRTTISLGNLFGGNSGEENEVKVDVAQSKQKIMAPPGVPVVSNWKQNPDGSISGKISNSPNFSDGDSVTTSPVPQRATSNSVVKSSSGSRYFLEQGQQQSTGFSFGFGIQKPKSQKAEETPVEPKRNPAAAFAAKRKVEADSKRLAAEAKAEAAASAEAKRAKAAALAEERKAAAAAAAEAKRAKAAAAAEAKRSAAEERKVKARAQAEKKKAAAEEQKAKAAAIAEERRVAAEAKRQAVAKKKSASVKTSGFLQRERSASNAAAIPKVEQPPKGVPVIKSWKKRADGGVSGRIYGSPNFEDGDFVETSPISQGKIENGSVVATKSRSRYFLSAETAVKKSNIMAAFKDLAGAKPGATITLTKERKEREAKAAVEAIEKGKPRATFSLFGLGFGDVDEGLPPKKEPVRSTPKKNTRKKKTSPKAKVAPKGVPTMNRWKMNRDGSITGIISGSINFNEGERVTTSMITKGIIDQGEIVTTGSGSRYFLG